jgi:hypothetical protein
MFQIQYLPLFGTLNILKFEKLKPGLPDIKMGNWPKYQQKLAISKL